VLDGGRESALGKPRLELRGLPEHLHDAELTAVVEAARDDACMAVRRRMIDRIRRRVVQ